MHQVQIRSEFSVKTQNTHFCSSLGLLSQLLRGVVVAYISSPTRMSLLFDTTFHQYQKSKVSVLDMFSSPFLSVGRKSPEVTYSMTMFPFVKAEIFQKHRVSKARRMVTYFYLLMSHTLLNLLMSHALLTFTRPTTNGHVLSQQHQVKVGTTSMYTNHQHLVKVSTTSTYTKQPAHSTIISVEQRIMVLCV